MPTYKYSARDIKSTQPVSGELDAENEAAVAKMLQERGLAPLDITSKEESGAFLSGLRNRIPGKQKVIFSRQLATLVGAGLPLIQSLNSVRDQSASKPLKEVLGKIINDVESGTALSEAMGRHPRVFDNVYVNMVAAGEASGTLDKSLERLATQQEKDAEILSKVRGALIYPLIVLTVLFGVVIFMVTTVLPSVQGLYQDLPGAELPAITKLLLSLSNALTGFWWVFLLVFGFGAFAFSRYARSTPGRYTLDRLRLRIPVVGLLYLKLYMARFSRIGSTLVASGMPIIQMLNTTAGAVGNIHVTNSINKATELVKTGKPLSDSLEGDPNFTTLVPSMIRIGEQSGSLEKMLERLADYYEKEVDNQIKSVSTIIEPVLMIAVGIIAMIVVAAVLLPIYSLAGKTTSF